MKGPRMSGEKRKMIGGMCPGCPDCLPNFEELKESEVNDEDLVRYYKSGTEAA